MKTQAGESPVLTGEDLPHLGSKRFRAVIVFLFVLGLASVFLAPVLGAMLGPLLTFLLLGIGVPLLSRQSAVHADSRVEERGGCLVITTPRPSHLRMGALLLLAAIMLFFPTLLTGFAFGVGSNSLSPVSGMLSALLGPLTLVLLPILLLVLMFGDRHTVQRVVWGHPRLYRSLAMGPLEFFSQRVTRRENRPPVLLPPLAVEVRDLMQNDEKMKAARSVMAQQGMSPEQIDQMFQQYLQGAATSGQLPSNSLYWTIVLPHFAGQNGSELATPEIPQVTHGATRKLSLELARFKEEAPALDLLERLLAARAPLPRNIERILGMDGALSSGMSLAASWLLRAPLFAGLALCLLAAWLSVEARLMLHGKLEFTPPWDTVAEAQLERFEWLISPVRNPFDAYPSYTAQTVARVRVETDGANPGQTHALEWPHYGRSSTYTSSPGSVLKQAARSRLLPAQLSFAVPRSVLDIEVDEHGVLRLDRLNMDRARARGETGPYRQLYFDVLLGMDTLDRTLPIYWMQPGLEERFRVVYSASDPSGTPLQRELDALAGTPDMISFNGFSDLLGFHGLLFGLGLVGLLAALNGHLQLADAHKTLGMMLLWLLVCASALFWMPRFPAMTGWVGLNSPPVASLREALRSELYVERVEAPVYEDTDLVRGRWEPSGSRHARWLAELDLLAPPAQRPLSFEAAVELLHTELSTRLDALDWPQRQLFLARYRPDLLRDNGTSRMHAEAIAPAICRWLDSGEPEVEGLQRYANTLSYVRCGT